jgi:hypothetical protein
MAFRDVAWEAVLLHEQKSKDYGTEADPYANVRAAEEFGLPSWVGIYIRMNDKMTRVKNFVRKGSLANEGIRDSLLDMFVYAGIALDEFDRVNGEVNDGVPAESSET